MTRIVYVSSRSLPISVPNQERFVNSGEDSGVRLTSSPATKPTRKPKEKKKKKRIMLKKNVPHKERESSVNLVRYFYHISKKRVEWMADE